MENLKETYLNKVKLSEENKNLIKKHLTKEDFNKIEKEFIKWREESIDAINNENCDQFSLYDDLEIQELDFEDVRIGIEKLRDSNKINFIFTAGSYFRTGGFFEVIKINDIDFSNDNIELPKDYKGIVKEWLEEELNKSNTWKLIFKILPDSTRNSLEDIFFNRKEEAIKKLKNEIENIKFKYRDDEDEFTKGYVEREVRKLERIITKLKIRDLWNSGISFSSKEKGLEITFTGEDSKKTFIGRDLKHFDFREKVLLPYENIFKKWIETKEK